MDRLLCIKAFVRVAQTRNFAEAARQLGVTSSVVTNRVHQLEEFINAPLFHRSTRHVRLSEIGEVYYAKCAEMVDGFETLTEQMRQSQLRPEGKLRLQMLPGYAIRHFGPHLAEFTRAYPEIEFDITVADRVTDPIEEGFDLAFQIFPPHSESLLTRQLFPVHRVFCASPAYLSRHGTPSQPEDLTDHTIGVYSDYPTRNRWQFKHNTKSCELVIPGHVRSNSVHLLHDYATVGGGIVCLPTLVASDSLISGALVPVLHDYEIGSFSFSAVFPSTQRRTLKVKALIDFLAERIGEEPPWDTPLRERGWLR